MKQVLMYSTRYCPFCVRAKSLLKSKNVSFEDIAIDGKAALRQKMIQASGRTSVPQIWIGDVHVGGCDELISLDRRGQLDSMLVNIGEGTGNE
jgi:glutaredoxin 3